MAPTDGVGSGPITYPIARDKSGELVAASALERATLPPEARFRCIRCDQRVRPVLGDVRCHHFRHDQDSPCAGEGGGEGEGILHHMAKTIFFAVYSEQLRRGCPYHLVRTAPDACGRPTTGTAFPCPYAGTARETRDLTAAYDRIVEERGDGAHRPDFTLSSSVDPAQRCWIEIVVSNPPDAAKRARGVPLLTIQVTALADLDRLVLPQLIEGAQHGVSLVNWPGRAGRCACASARAPVPPRPLARPRPPTDADERMRPAAWLTRPRSGLVGALSPVAGVAEAGEDRCRALAESTGTVPYYAARRAHGERPVVAALAALGDGYRVDEVADCRLCGHATWYLGAEYGFPSRVFCQQRQRAVSCGEATDCPTFELDLSTPP